MQCFLVPRVIEVPMNTTRKGKSSINNREAEITTTDPPSAYAGVGAVVDWSWAGTMMVMKTMAMKSTVTTTRGDDQEATRIKWKTNSSQRHHEVVMITNYNLTW
jgi:hypothetical protein